MLIEGPFKLQIIEKEETRERELHITFKEDYHLLDLQDRVQQMKQHFNDLHTHYHASNDNAEKQGIQMIIQVVSQILPLIESGEVACDETIVLELGGTTPINNIIKEITIN